MLREMVSDGVLIFRAELARAVGTANGRFNPEYEPSPQTSRGSGRWDEDSRAGYHKVNRSAVRGERGQSGMNWGDRRIQGDTKSGR